MQEIMHRQMKEFWHQKENIILEQLNELLSRNLLEIQETEPILIHDADTAQVRMQQSIRLVPKEFEYIQKLERENNELKTQLAHIRALLLDAEINN